VVPGPASPSERDDHVFHRNLLKSYPMAVRAQGVYITDDSGKRYLDASSGAVAANLGHGVQEIVDAMAAQAGEVAFAHTLRFETHVLHRAAGKIAALAPEGLDTVFFASGGSEANEAAIKLARQFHLDRGNPSKHLVIGRQQSYHGNTLGALSAGGDVVRRGSFAPILLPFPHVPALPLRDDEGVEPTTESGSLLPEAGQLGRVLAEVGAENVAAFICEPIVGSQQGALVPPQDYLTQVRRLCDEHDILLIVDEVMTGFGRTGKNFAVEHFGVTPDILTFGKGVTGGYAPLSGMVVAERIVDTIRDRSEGVFRHGYTYSGHPVSVAAADAALAYYADHRVLENVVHQGEYLWARLQELQARHPRMSGLRGKGLLLGFDLVDVEGAAPLTSEEFNQRAMDNGAVFYPGRGAIDGVRGQHLLVAPPLTIRRQDVDRLIDILDQTLAAVETTHASEGHQS
jgi:adenosylmethionine-8-amino-7-oxononanoate aminotransferase